jgi:very-short-patch-repair endonuclease
MGRMSKPRANKADVFAWLWEKTAPPGSPVPEREYQFNKSQSKHAFDFAWPKWKVAVEVDGGQWQSHGGRHARDTDRVKLNLAAELGWRVLRYSPEMLESKPYECILQVCNALVGKK